jgi:hypothetical protein
MQVQRSDTRRDFLATIPLVAVSLAIGCDQSKRQASGNYNVSSYGGFAKEELESGIELLVNGGAVLQATNIPHLRAIGGAMALIGSIFKLVLLFDSKTSNKAYEVHHSYSLTPQAKAAVRHHVRVVNSDDITEDFSDALSLSQGSEILKIQPGQSTRYALTYNCPPATNFVGDVKEYQALRACVLALGIPCQQRQTAITPDGIHLEYGKGANNGRPREDLARIFLDKSHASNMYSTLAKYPGFNARLARESNDQS